MPGGIKIDGLLSAVRGNAPALMDSDRQRFDQRPGVLDATRGLAAAPFALIGQRLDDGWRGRLETNVALNPSQMRDLARELQQMADLFDERIDW
jgi:hypothetical protein